MSRALIWVTSVCGAGRQLVPFNVGTASAAGELRQELVGPGFDGPGRAPR